jgi:hypothetical protein
MREEPSLEMLWFKNIRAMGKVQKTDPRINVVCCFNNERRACLSYRYNIQMSYEILARTESSNNINNDTLTL